MNPTKCSQRKSNGFYHNDEEFRRTANLKSICDMIHVMHLRTTIEATMTTVIDEFVICDNVR